METKSEISCSGLFNYFLWISSLPKAIFGRENIDNVGDFLLNTATEQTRYLSSYRKYIEYTNTMFAVVIFFGNSSLLLTYTIVKSVAIFQSIYAALKGPAFK